MRLNVARRRAPVFTHEGAKAAHITPEQELRRSVMACLLWEDQFYENGEGIAARIERLSKTVKPETVASIASEARNVMHLRHVPLLVAASLAGRTDLKLSSLIAETIDAIIQRPDELGEFLKVYWRNGKVPLDHQVKRGLARAFSRFDEYQFAKYDRDGEIKLRDVLRLVRPKPVNAEQSELFRKIVKRELATPDTWEVALSAGADKKETFTRLIKERKLGYLALLRNLRNMEEAGVDANLIEEAILARRGAHNVLPFRYLSAARIVPRFEGALSKAMLAGTADLPYLSGTTVVCVDNSGSMRAKLSQKSVVTRSDAAATLAGVIQSDKVRVIAFGTTAKEVPHRPGLAQVDAVQAANVGMGTEMGLAVELANGMKPDRIIVISDEQTAGQVPAPACKHAYGINTASYQNGVMYGRGWIHIDGWSDGVIRYLAASEGLGLAETDNEA